jgi:hypothetical protein
MNTGREQLLGRVFVDNQRRKKRTGHTQLKQHAVTPIS